MVEENNSTVAKSKKPVVIGYCREVSMVHAISTLIENGYQVIAFDSFKYAPGLYISALKDKFIDESIQKDEHCYLNFLSKIGSQYPDSILLTGDDYTSYVICKYQAELSKYYHFLTPDYQTYNKIINKYLLSNLAKENKLNVSPTAEITNLDTQAWSYPLMIKPKIGAGGRKQIKCLSSSQLQDFIQTTKNLDDYFTQEYPRSDHKFVYSEHNDGQGLKAGLCFFCQPT